MEGDGIRVEPLRWCSSGPSIQPADLAESKTIYEMADGTFNKVQAIWWCLPLMAALVVDVAIVRTGSDVWMLLEVALPMAALLVAGAVWVFRLARKNRETSRFLVAFEAVGVAVVFLCVLCVAVSPSAVRAYLFTVGPWLGDIWRTAGARFVQVRSDRLNEMIRLVAFAVPQLLLALGGAFVVAGRGGVGIRFGRPPVGVRLKHMMVLIAVIASILVAERWRQRQVFFQQLAADAGAREQAFRNFAYAAELSMRMAASQKLEAVDARSTEFWSKEEAAQANRAAEWVKKADEQSCIRSSYERRRW